MLAERGWMCLSYQLYDHFRAGPVLYILLILNITNSKVPFSGYFQAPASHPSSPPASSAALPFEEMRILHVISCSSACRRLFPPFLPLLFLLAVHHIPCVLLLSKHGIVGERAGRTFLFAFIGSKKYLFKPSSFLKVSFLKLSRVHFCLTRAPGFVSSAGLKN